MSRNDPKNVTTRPYDRRLVEALTSGETVKRAAELAGISKRTVFRRMSDSAFMAQLRTTRRQFTTVTLGRLANASSEAVNTLMDLLADESASIRLSAARALLSQCANWESQDLTDRIDEIERRIDRLWEKRNETVKSNLS